MTTPAATAPEPTAPKPPKPAVVRWPMAAVVGVLMGLWCGFYVVGVDWVLRTVLPGVFGAWPK